MNNFSRSDSSKDTDIKTRVRLTDLAREDKKKLVNLLDQLTKVTEENNIYRKQNTELKDELQKKNEIVAKYCSQIVQGRENYEKEICRLKYVVQKLENENSTIRKDSIAAANSLSHEIKILKDKCYQKQNLQQEIETYKNNLDKALSSIKYLHQQLKEKLNEENNKTNKATQVSEKDIMKRYSDKTIPKHKSNDKNCFQSERNYSEEQLLSELFFTSNSYGNLIESLFFVNTTNSR